MLVTQEASHNSLRNMSKKQKKRKTDKSSNKQKSLNLTIFLNKIFHIHKTVTNCYLKTAQVKGFFQCSFEAVKQNNR